MRISTYMNHNKLQNQYNKIYSFFKTTSEAFDYIDWDGKTLFVWNNCQIIEKYSLEELKEIYCI